jgi:hypothetical protein
MIKIQTIKILNKSSKGFSYFTFICFLIMWCGSYPQDNRIRKKDENSVIFYKQIKSVPIWIGNRNNWTLFAFKSHP